MSINNPVGNIPIKTPILLRMKKALDGVYLSLSEKEMIELDNEIKSVNEQNCNCAIKEIADMYACVVDGYVKRYIRGE